MEYQQKPPRRGLPRPAAGPRREFSPEMPPRDTERTAEAIVNFVLAVKTTATKTDDRFGGEIFESPLFYTLGAALFMLLGLGVIVLGSPLIGATERLTAEVALAIFLGGIVIRLIKLFVVGR